MPNPLSERVGVEDYRVLWTIYKNPLDFPGRFVLRRWIEWESGDCHPEPAPWHVGTSLEEVRQRLPGGLTRLPRQEWQDPVIVETWF